MKLDVKSLALALGFLWGGIVFLATLWVWFVDGGDTLLLLRRFYIGYSVSLYGSLIGLIWGVLSGGLVGAILAWLYNRLGANA